MNKQQYQYFKNKVETKINDLKIELQDAKNDYIKLNSPCKIGDKIELTHNSGRKEKMVVKAFTVLNDDVYVSQFKAIKDGKETGPNRFISAGHGEIKILSHE